MEGINSQELWERIVSAVGQSGVEELTQAALTWGAIGAAIGLAVALVFYFGFKLLGWYKCATTGGRWAKRIVVVLAAMLVIGLGAIAGAGEGIRRRSEHVITHSQLGRDVLPPVADFFADTCVWLDLAAEQRGVPSDAAMAARVEAFRSGRWDLDVPIFFERLGTLRTETFTAILGKIEELIHREAPALKDGATGRMLHRVIHEFGPGMLDDRFASEMKGRGLEPLRLAIRDRLLAEAARAGDPRKIRFSELSRFLLNQAVVPGMVAPIDSFVRQQQLFLGIVALIVLVLPAIVCRIFRGQPATAPVAGSTEPQPARVDRT